MYLIRQFTLMGVSTHGSHQDWKTGKMGRHFPVREFYPEYWKNQKKLCWKIEKDAGKVTDMQIWYHTLNEKQH